jgi:hypothetical protein
MTQHSPPQGVHLLKQLLFDRETRRLEDIGRRLEAEAADAARRHKETGDQQSALSDQQKALSAQQKALSDKIDAVFERTGTTEKLQHSVADIIDGALREAEVVRHDSLSRAIAPLVVRTIKIQLRDSQDEMVEALYPITGRLVQSYVQSAMAEMMVKINAKLGGGGAAQLAAQSWHCRKPTGSKSKSCFWCGAAQVSWWRTGSGRIWQIGTRVRAAPIAISYSQAI